MRDITTYRNAPSIQPGGIATYLEELNKSPRGRGSGKRSLMIKFPLVISGHPELPCYGKLRITHYNHITEPVEVRYSVEPAMLTSHTGRFGEVRQIYQIMHNGSCNIAGFIYRTNNLAHFPAEAIQNIMLMANEAFNTRIHDTCDKLMNAIRASRVPIDAQRSFIYTINALDEIIVSCDVEFDKNKAVSVIVSEEET